ncbi:MAG TPA: phage holin family protein [Nocardioidaceae bacterium]|nr:phage holin family protein [Nocardioidaceae bacterium]
MAHRTAPPATPEEPTIGRLIVDTSRDFSDLLHKEIELAKTELRVSVRAGGTGIALFAAAAFLILLGVVMASFAAAFGIDNIDGIDTWLAFLIVFGIYVLIAAILAFIGVRKVKKVKAPEQTIAAVKSTTQVLKRGG